MMYLSVLGDGLTTTHHGSSVCCRQSINIVSPSGETVGVKLFSHG